MSDLANLLQPFYIPSAPGGDLPQKGHLIGLRRVQVVCLLVFVHYTDTSLSLPRRDLPPSKLPIPSADFLMRAYCEAVDRQFPIQGWTACVSFAFFRVSALQPTTLFLRLLD